MIKNLLAAIALVAHKHRDQRRKDECSGQTTIVDFAGRVQSDCLLLEGKCSQCGTDVARFLEK